jgi:Carboxypeptidase regulatory-like domain
MFLLKSLCIPSIPSLGRRFGKRHIVALVALFLGLSLQAFAQEATILGTVTDPSGSVIANVKVTFTNAETGLVHTIASNESGQYVAPNLHIGHYNVKAEATGFKVAEQKGILLQVGDRVRVDFQMQVGAASETITVEATPIRVQTDTGEVSNLITDQQLEQISTNGRSIYVLAGLTAGASSNITGLLNVPVGGDSTVSFNGLRPAHNIYLLDGGEDLDRGGSGNMSIAPSSDAIAEFRALTSNYSAEYGLSSAGTMTMVLKSGSSTLHASAWEFNREDGFDARDFFHPAPSTKTKLRMNIFGFNAGGPVTLGHLYNPDKKKTFFFYNMEWRKYIIGAGSNQTVPALATYGGDFTGQLPDDIVLKGAGNPDAGKTVPFSGLHAPCSNQLGTNAALLALFAGQTLSTPVLRNGKLTCDVDPTQPLSAQPTFAAFNLNKLPFVNGNSAALLTAGIFPSAGLANVGKGVGTFRGGSGVPTNLKEEVVRIDHNFTSKFSVFGHFVSEQISQGYATAQWSGDNLPTVGDTFGNPSYSGVVHTTYTINPTLINEVAFNYNGNRINIIPFAANGLKSLSLPTAYDSTSSRLFTGPNNLTRVPNITLNGQSGANFQIASWPWRNKADDYQIRDDVSWTKGTHQFRFGGSWAIYKKVQDLFGTTQGAFTFTGNAGTYTGNSFGDFLLGLPQSYQELAVQDHGFWNNVSWAAYVQDNWRVTHRLTLNLGLRWDGAPHTYEANNRMGNFYPSLYNSADKATFDSNHTICSGASDPGCTAASPGLGSSPNSILAGVPLYLNGIGIPGQNGVPKGLVDNNWTSFGPRLGFAYDLSGSGKTVVRGGFGIMYERIQGNDMYNAGPNIPFSLNVTLNNTEFTNPSLAINSGTAASRPINAASITGLDKADYKNPASYQYSLGVQRALSSKTVLSVAYVGNTNRHQNDYRNINLPTESALPGLIGTPYQVATGLPYPGFNQITMSENAANSHYNALQVDLNSQVKDIQLRVLYSYSRTIDSSTGGSSGDLANVSNPYGGWRFDLGPGALDRTHTFVTNFIYDIPVFRRTSSRLVKSTIGGWEVSGIVTMESGLPMNLTAGTGVENFLGSGASSRPDLTGKIAYPNTVLTTGNQNIQYFDSTAFARPASGTWGNLGHNALRGPGRDNWDMSLFKNFTLSESRGSRFELRLETFNTWNHTQFQNVDTGFGDSRFGQFTSAYNARILQLGGKIYF